MTFRRYAAHTSFNASRRFCLRLVCDSCAPRRKSRTRRCHQKFQLARIRLTARSSLLSPEPAANDTQLQIYDPAGTLIKGYSSAPIPPKKEEDNPFIAPYWIAHPQALSREKGMHRLIWDLRYTDRLPFTCSRLQLPIAAIVGATPLPPQGPLVMPGKYELRLKVGEQVLRQPLEVENGPARLVHSNELQSSLDLQLKISAALGRNFAAITK